MRVEVLRHPTDDDWKRCYRLAVGTEGKDVDKLPTLVWKRKILDAGHSPIRTLMFTIRLHDIPYWVSVHLTRHKIGVEHYVQSQRNDRQSNYDRTKAPQDSPVTHTMDINAETLMTISHRRLCGKASPETREVWTMVCAEVMKVNPEFAPVLVPMCTYRGGQCHEMKPCSTGQHVQWPEMAPNVLERP